MKNHTPKDLAVCVSNVLRLSKTFDFPPPDEVLTGLMETLYFASMQTEEGEYTRVNVTFIDPGKVKKYTKDGLRADHWSFVPFKNPIKFDQKNIVKLSKAADPWSSSIAVYYDAKNELFIYGMIDQAIHSQRFLNHEMDFKPLVPGIFQVQITGIGSLSVMYEFELVATLKQSVLVTKFLDVLKYGPVSAALARDASQLKPKLQSYIKTLDKRANFEEWRTLVENTWRDSISRILIQIRNYHHGGAILITDNAEGLEVKYELAYSRLNSAIYEMLKKSITEQMLNGEMVDNSEETMNQEEFLDYEQNRAERIAATNQLKGSIRFIASQTCVDGLVLMNHKLEVLGFGAVIKDTKLPDFVYQSDTNRINPDKLMPRDPHNFGTRHQSMIAYCWKHEDAIGFVVSQDGDIRAFKNINGKVIMWENIKTQKYIKSSKIKHLGTEEKLLGIDGH
ncbi:MAG: hypothetical protein JSU01_01775 [Bacteroidetes bacterium]|nr:hypothetical protein [Bacteroidota bacterium]